MNISSFFQPCCGKSNFLTIYDILSTQVVHQNEFKSKKMIGNKLQETSQPALPPPRPAGSPQSACAECSWPLLPLQHQWDLHWRPRRSHMPHSTTRPADERETALWCHRNIPHQMLKWFLCFLWSIVNNSFTGSQVSVTVFVKSWMGSRECLCSVAPPSGWQVQLSAFVNQLMRDKLLTLPWHL